MGRIASVFGIFSLLLLLTGCKMDVDPADPCSCTNADCILTIPDTANYQDVANLECSFKIPTGFNIHEVVVDIETDTTFVFDATSRFYLSHSNTGNSPDLDYNEDENYHWNLSGTTGGISDIGLHVTITYPTAGEIRIILNANPTTSGDEGTFDDFTSDWTWTITSPDLSATPDVDILVTTSATSTTGDVLVDSKVDPVDPDVFGPLAHYDDIDIEEPEIEIPTPSGLRLFTLDSDVGIYLSPSGDSVDFDSSYTYLIAGGQTFAWDFDVSGSALPSANVQDPAAYVLDSAAPLPSPHTEYDISVTVRATGNGCIATDSVVLYVKNPPQITNLSVDSPGTAPPYGDAPLDVDLSATVIHGDPFTEGDGDNDGNTTDYTLSWNFGDGSPPAPTGETLTSSHTYSTTGIHDVELTITDDYGLTANPVSDPISSKFNDTNSYPTDEAWIFTIDGLDGHSLNVSASATELSSYPVPITCQCICS